MSAPVPEGTLAVRIVSGGMRGFGVQAVGRVARLLYELVVSRVLGAAGFGVFALAVSAFDLGRAFAYFGVDHAIVRFVAIHDARDERSRVRGVLGWGAVIGVGSAVLSALGLFWFAPVIAQRVFAMPQLEQGLRFVAIALLPNAILILIAAAVRARGHVALERALQTVWPPLALAALVGGSVWVTRSLAVAFYAFAAAYLVCAGIATVSARRVFADLRGVPTELSRSTLRDIVAFAGPMFLLSFATLLLLEGARLLLGRLGTAADVGVFTVASRLATQLTIFFVGFDSLIAPLFARMSAEGPRDNLRRAVQVASGSVTALTIPLMLVYLGAPAVLMGLFGTEFVRGVRVLQLVALGQFFLIVVGPTGRLLQMSGRAGVDLANTVMAVAVVTAGSWCLIPDHGALGAAVAVTAGIVILNALRFVQVVLLLGIWPAGWDTLKVLVAGGMGYAAGLILPAGRDAGQPIAAVLTTGVMVVGYLGAAVLLVGPSRIVSSARALRRPNRVSRMDGDA